MMSSQVLRQRIVGWPAGFLWLGPDPLDWMEYICPGSAQVLIQLSVCCIKVCACLHICVQPGAGWQGWARVGCSRSGAPPFWLAPKTPFDVYACRRCMDLSVQWLFWFGCGSSVVFLLPDPGVPAHVSSYLIHLTSWRLPEKTYMFNLSHWPSWLISIFLRCTTQVH